MSRKKLGANRPNLPSYSSEYVYVSVFCDGSPEHAHARFKVATFLPSIRDGGAVWAVSPGGYSEPHSEGVVRSTPIPRFTAQWLVGDSWVPRQDNPFEANTDGYRERWHLVCKTCGVAKVIADPAAFYPALDELEAKGFREVDIQHFLHSTR